MMTPQLVSELERINDREVALSPRDHSAIPDMIRPRQTQAFRCCLVYNRLYSVMYYLLRFPVPQPGPRLASSTSHHPLPPQSRGPGLSFSRRNPSGASVASSRSQTKSLSMCVEQNLPFPVAAALAETLSAPCIQTPCPRRGGAAS